MLEQERMNAGLGDARLPAALANWNDKRGGRGEGEHFVRDQVVGEDDVRGLQQAQGAQGEQFGIAGARSDEVDDAGLRRSAQDLGSLSAAGSGLVRACSRARVREGQPS